MAFGARHRWVMYMVPGCWVALGRLVEKSQNPLQNRGLIWEDANSWRLRFPRSRPVAQLVLVAGLDPFPYRVARGEGTRQVRSFLSVEIPPACCCIVSVHLYHRMSEGKFHLDIIIGFANVDQPSGLPLSSPLPGPGTQECTCTEYHPLDVRIAAKGNLARTSSLVRTIGC